jgi:hypothetical protein
MPEERRIARCPDLLCCPCLWNVERSAQLFRRGFTVVGMEFSSSHEIDDPGGLGPDLVEIFLQQLRMGLPCAAAYADASV